MSYGTKSFDEKSPKDELSTTDRIEDISGSDHDAHLAELSGIEAEAASKAAWLITLTVSLGGLLFGEYLVHSEV